MTVPTGPGWVGPPPPTVAASLRLGVVGLLLLVDMAPFLSRWMGRALCRCLWVKRMEVRGLSVVSSLDSRRQIPNRVRGPRVSAYRRAGSDSDMASFFFLILPVWLVIAEWQCGVGLAGEGSTTCVTPRRSHQR